MALYFQYEVDRGEVPIICSSLRGTVTDLCRLPCTFKNSKSLSEINTVHSVQYWDDVEVPKKHKSFVKNHSIL
jgi:hypothetical protein